MSPDERIRIIGSLTELADKIADADNKHAEHTYKMRKAAGVLSVLTVVGAIFCYDLLVVMVGVSIIIPYKETICLPVSFSLDLSSKKGIALADSQHVALLDTGMYMSFDMFGEKEKAVIKKILSHRINGKYQVEVKLLNEDEITIPMKVEGTITVLDKTWFQKIVGK